MAAYTYDVAVNNSQISLGNDVYAKVLPLTVSPWTTGQQTAYPSADGVTTFEFDNTALDTTLSYNVYANQTANAFTATNATNLINSSAIVSADDGALVYLSGSDLPNGLTAGKKYWVINVVDGVSFQVEATQGSGTAVTFSDDGTGTRNYTISTDRASTDLVIGTIQALESVALGEGETDAIVALIGTPTNTDLAGDHDALDALLDAIKAKTDLIGTGTATVTQPVSSAGTLSAIVIGDDYKSTNSRAFTWTVTDPGNIATPASATCVFGGKRVNGTDVWSVSGTVADAGGGNLTLTFELDATDTASLDAGKYYWSVELQDDSSNEITTSRNAIGGYVELVEKQT